MHAHALENRPTFCTFVGMKEEQLLNLTELAGKFPELGRNLLSKYGAVHDLLPWHNKPGKKATRHYYKESEVRKVIKALEPLRAKEIPLKICRAELMRLAWYRDLREKE